MVAEKSQCWTPATILRFLHFLISLLLFSPTFYLLALNLLFLRCERRKLFSFMSQICVFLLCVFFALKQFDSESRLIGNSSINIDRNMTIIGNNGNVPPLWISVRTCMNFLNRVLWIKSSSSIRFFHYNNFCLTYKLTFLCYILARCEHIYAFF